MTTKVKALKRLVITSYRKCFVGIMITLATLSAQAQEGLPIELDETHVKSSNDESYIAANKEVRKELFKAMTQSFLRAIDECSPQNIEIQKKQFTILQGIAHSLTSSITQDIIHFNASNSSEKSSCGVIWYFNLDQNGYTVATYLNKSKHIPQSNPYQHTMHIVSCAHIPENCLPEKTVISLKDITFTTEYPVYQEGY